MPTLRGIRYWNYLKRILEQPSKNALTAIINPLETNEKSHQRNKSYEK